MALRRRRTCPCCSEPARGRGRRRLAAERPARSSAAPCAGAAAPRRRLIADRGDGRRARRRSLLVVGDLAGLAAGPGDVLLLARTRGRRFPPIARAFWLNVRMFLVAEPLILVLGAAGRGRPQRPSRRCWSPLRLARGRLHRPVPRGPDVLLVLPGRLRDARAAAAGRHRTACSGWATVALVLSYGAYVAEVFRAGIESIHPSQVASAAALGLSPRPDACATSWCRRRCAASYRRCSTTSSRCRRTPRWSPSVGVFEALFAGAGLRQLQLQLHAVRRGRGVLRGADDPAGPVHRLAAAAATRERERAGGPMTRAVLRGRGRCASRTATRWCSRDVDLDGRSRTTWSA